LVRWAKGSNKTVVRSNSVILVHNAYSLSSHQAQQELSDFLAMMWKYLLFHKPYGVLTQFSDRAVPPRPTLKDYIPISDVYPVGRLDRDSEGLLLLTNHGALQHRLSDPQFGHPRTYWVQVEGNPTEAALEPLRQGVSIQDYRTRPVQVHCLTKLPDLPDRDPPIRVRQHIPTAWLEMTLTEGRNRQVRRMTAAIGFPTLRLVRVAIAHLGLEQLSPGAWRSLHPGEIAQLYQHLCLRP
jgi:23S rRNA pseudouridine2457 synthase